MFKKVRKVVLLLVLTGLILNCFSPLAHAEEENETLLVEIGTATGTKDHIVEIPINLSNVPLNGLEHFDFKLKYETEDIEILDLEPGEIIRNPETDFAVSINANTGILIFCFSDMSAIAERTINDDGILATLIARIKNEDETFSAITKLTNSNPIFGDYDYTYYPFVFKSGGVKIDKFVADEIVIAPRDTLLVSTSTSRGTIGDIVDLKVSLDPLRGFSNSPGLKSLEAYVRYDNLNLELLEIIPSDELDRPDLNLNYTLDNEKDEIVIEFDNNDIHENSFIGPHFVTLRFEIKSGEVNSILPVHTLITGISASLNLPENDIRRRVNSIAEEGGIIVDRKLPNVNYYRVEIEDVSAKIGETVLVPILLKDVPNDGIEQLYFDYIYDTTKLDLKYILNGELLEDDIRFVSGIDRTNGKIGFYVMKSNNKITEDGVFAYLKFRIKENLGFESTEILTETATTILYPSPQNISKVTGGNIHISPILGDLNGDGVINSTDYVLLRRYVLEIIDDIPVGNVYHVADLNNDGKIDSTDCVILRKYILKIISSF
ncbi:UNVERIFIED_CONTAM: dockerin type I repeat protein [Acetivibrio alkalicellulosi]